MKTFELEIQEMARDATQENAGILSVHLEYLCRTHEVFSKWKGLCSAATWVAYAAVEGNPKQRLLDFLWIISIELKRRQRLSQSRALKRTTRMVTNVTEKM